MDSTHGALDTYSSPLGDIDLASINGKLCLCNWSNKKNKITIANRLKRHLQISHFNEQPCQTLALTKQQLDSYFAGELTQFNIPLQFAGTTFQQQVWQALLTIPYGQTISYAQLAQRLDQPKAVGAVANANAANALSIIVPCHRIIGSNSKLTG